MSKKMSSVAAIGMLLLLFGGYALPIMVTGLEDRHLQSVKKSFEIEKIEIKTSEIDFFQELYRFPELMVGEVYMQKKEEELENGWVYQKAKETIIEFLTMLNIEITYEFEQIQVFSFVLADWEMEVVYPIWYCEAVYQEKQMYKFWIDEITGKILAFQIPADIFLTDDENFPNRVKMLADYYGFESYEFQAEYYKMGKMKKWAGFLLVRDNETKEERALLFYKEDECSGFNIYPGMWSETDAKMISGMK